eukprot:2461482-Rhodomonas_salina.11
MKACAIYCELPHSGYRLYCKEVELSFDFAAWRIPLAHRWGRRPARKFCPGSRMACVSTGHCVASV